MNQTKISALIHTCNHALQLGRALDSLRACDELIVVDHSSADDTVRVAREHGARVLQAVSGADGNSYLDQAGHDWLLCLLPEESLAEDLETSIFEWRLAARKESDVACNVAIREQQDQQWRLLPAETRLANRTRVRWREALPEPVPDAQVLQGHILRIPDIK